jgi:TetR/AcrR family transcriptional regulator
MNTPDGAAPQGLAPAELDARTRSRLIRAAVQVFDKKGYDAASVREIVEMAGVTKPALYYHFGSKEGLLKAILTAGAREFENTIAPALERQGSARERLTALCEDLYGVFTQNLSFVRVTHAVFLGPTDIAPDFDFSVYETAIVNAMDQIVRDGQANGEVRAGSPQDIALALLGVVTEVFGRHLHPRMDQLGVAGLRRLLDLVFDGVLTDGSNSHEPGEERQ